MVCNLKLPDRTKNLIQLLESINFEAYHNLFNHEINYITHDSRQVRENSIFVAINGFNVDGHNYIQEAINRGARVIVGQKQISELPIPPGITYIQSSNTRKLLATLSSEFYDYPARGLKMIGVTGSSGKTTTTFMIDNILAENMVKSGLIGTLYTKIGSKFYNNPHQCTTPEAHFLQAKLAEMRSQGIEHACLEVSSHALKLERVRGIRFDIAIFTNLSYDHMQFHQDIEDYCLSKARLFGLLKGNGVGIINLDDEYSRYFLDKASHHYTYGLKSRSADITAGNISIEKRRLSFELEINQVISTLENDQLQPRKYELTLPLTGYHNIYNALAAFTAGIVLGFEPVAVIRGLESFSGVPRRMELIYDEEFMIIDDFAHNPASLKANFRTIEEFDYNRLIILHFLKGKRGVDSNTLNARLFREWAPRTNLEEIITTRAEGEVSDKNKVLPEEERAFGRIIEDSGIKLSSYRKLKPAIKYSLDLLNKDDLLLLLGGPGLDGAREVIYNLLD